jgi:hypothetical protein
MERMKLNLKKTIGSMGRLAIAAALGAAMLPAEDLPVHVNIPFAFTVHGNAMPAGEYTIKPLEGAAGVVSLHHETMKANMLAIALPGTKPADLTTLTFTEVDSTKALTLVRTPGWSMSFLAPAPLLKPVAARTEVPGVAALLSKR